MNKLRAIQVQTQHYDGTMQWLTVRFWRKDKSRYYSTETMTDASFKRVGRFMFKHGEPQFNRSSISVDWFSTDQSAWEA